MAADAMERLVRHVRENVAEPEPLAPLPLTPVDVARAAAMSGWLSEPDARHIPLAVPAAYTIG